MYIYICIFCFSFYYSWCDVLQDFINLINVDVDVDYIDVDVDYIVCKEAYLPRCFFFFLIRLFRPF